jgi:broad specificity phosphatase PhoE
VALAFPSGWKTAGELQDWRQGYDTSPVLPGPADIGPIPWSRCLCSDLDRALATAGIVFHGPIETTALLREPCFQTFATGRLRLPVGLWIWMVRLAWFTGHGSQRACRDEFLQRVTAIADLLEQTTVDTLVVSHAGMMTYLSAELRRRRFLGPRLRMPRHATLHLYERAQQPRPSPSPKPR